MRDPQTKRGAVALEDGTTVLAVGGKPGEATYRRRGSRGSRRPRTATAATTSRRSRSSSRTLKQRPDHPALLYETACYEALLGRRDDAIAHLRDAVGREPRFAESAATDEDFASLAEDPEFLAITGQAEPGGGGA